MFRLIIGRWSIIIGGTGAFTNAHGNIKYKDVQSIVTSITDNVREPDIFIYCTLQKHQQRYVQLNKAVLYLYYFTSNKCP